MMGRVVVVVRGGNENVLEPDRCLSLLIFWKARLQLSCGGGVGWGGKGGRVVGLFLYVGS